MLKTSFVVALAVLGACSSSAQAAGCQKGVASAPYIGATDQRAIDRAALHLPAVRPGHVRLSVGAGMSGSVPRKPLPAPVAKVLPQYRSGGYTAFRVGERLVIIDRRDVLTYILPLGHPTRPGNCP